MRKLLVSSALAFVSCTAAQTTTPTPPPAVQPVVEAAPQPVAAPVVEDPYLWLEEIDAPKSLEWAKARNDVSTKELESQPGFAPLRDRLKAIADSKERIPWPEVHGGKALYNLWKDEAHPRGLWRRTTLAEFKKPAPKWEPVLDVDALNVTEKASWVWKGASCLPPKDERCLVRLSPGGGDAVVVREFDTVKKAFVAGGFELPAAKSEVTWKDENTVWVGTDFGPGSLTSSGYPRQVKAWKRGTKLAEATLVAEGEEADVAVQMSHEWDHGKPRDVLYRAKTFFSDETSLMQGGTLVKIDKPDDASVAFWGDYALLQLRSDWVVNEKVYTSGSLLVTTTASLLKGGRDFTVLFESQPHASLMSFVGLKSALVLRTLEDVKTVLTVVTPGKKGWDRKPLETSGLSDASVDPWSGSESDDYFFVESNFIQPATLSMGSLSKPKREVLKNSPVQFNAEGLEVTQHFATSKDGTKVPYFQVSKKGLTLDGSAPTLLEGYGGFEVSLTPYYDAFAGAAWLERGGVFVLANIRGGGEYGATWHQSAMREKRRNAYDDFAAVAKDLAERKVTRAEKLGIIGGSNGGLLMGVMLTQYSELFGAIVCQVPLLDMKRYHLLLAGASWMEEYGDPSKPEDWAFLKTFSPYQNVKKGQKVPRTLFTTSTRDDRVHPGHARKMVARLLEQGADVLYFENLEGGHGGAADSGQRSRLNALAYTFLGKQLGLP